MLFALWSAVGIVAEVPSGALADHVGRRTALVTGALVQAVGYACWVVFPGFAGLRGRLRVVGARQRFRLGRAGGIAARRAGRGGCRGALRPDPGLGGRGGTGRAGADRGDRDRAVRRRRLCGGRVGERRDLHRHGAARGSAAGTGSSSPVGDEPPRPDAVRPRPGAAYPSTPLPSTGAAVSPDFSEEPEASYLATLRAGRRGGRRPAAAPAGGAGLRPALRPRRVRGVLPARRPRPADFHRRWCPRRCWPSRSSVRWVPRWVVRRTGSPPERSPPCSRWAPCCSRSPRRSRIRRRWPVSRCSTACTAPSWWSPTRGCRSGSPGRPARR